MGQKYPGLSCKESGAIPGVAVAVTLVNVEILLEDRIVYLAPEGPNPPVRIKSLFEDLVRAIRIRPTAQLKSVLTMTWAGLPAPMRLPMMCTSAATQLPASRTTRLWWTRSGTLVGAWHLRSNADL